MNFWSAYLCKTLKLKFVQIDETQFVNWQNAQMGNAKSHDPDNFSIFSENGFDKSAICGYNIRGTRMPCCRCVLTDYGIHITALTVSAGASAAKPQLRLPQFQKGDFTICLKR